MSASAGVWPQRGEGKAIVQRERTGDHTGERDEAFAALVARHSRLMFRVAYALLRNPHDAEDAVQEALLKLYRNEAWRQMQDERGFLARTVWRVGLNRLPRKDTDDVAGMDLAATGHSPEAQTVEAAERAHLRRLIDGLPEDLRQVLLLSAIKEMTSREVALALSISDGTVRTRLMRAKAELKKRYEGSQEGRR